MPNVVTYDPWGVWTSTSSSTPITVQYVWNSWVNATSTSYVDNTSSTQTFSVAVWDRWNRHPTQHSMRRLSQRGRDVFDARCESRAASPQRNRQRIEVIERAETILCEHLPVEEVVRYHENKCFYVRAMSGRRYLIDCKKRQHNVFQVDEQGNKLMEHCALVSDPYVPDADNALAQLLMLRFNEQRFLEVANTWDLRHGRHLVAREERGVAFAENTEVIPSAGIALIAATEEDREEIEAMLADEGVVPVRQAVVGQETISRLAEVTEVTIDVDRLRRALHSDDSHDAEPVAV